MLHLPLLEMKGEVTPLRFMLLVIFNLLIYLAGTMHINKQYSDDDSDSCKCARIIQKAIFHL